MAIFFNESKINDWNFGDDNIIKVYRNNAVCYYKIGGSPTPTAQTPCYAVVDDISQYSSTEFVDVYDKATEKWYKLNNLNQFEEYGIYGNGRNITYYDGKLTIDSGYEYEYSDGAWVNRGELTGTTKIIKSPEYIQRTSTYNGYCSLLEYLTQDTKFIIKHRQTNAGGGRIIGDYNSNDNDDWRFFFYGSTLYYDFITQRQNTSKSMPMSAAEEWEVGNYYIKNTATSTNLITGTPQTFSSRPAPLYIYHSDSVGAGESGADYGEIYYIKIYKNNVLVRDFIPWTDMNGNYGLYDKVNDVTVQTTGQMTASTTINDVEIGDVVYPLYYTERQDPPNNLSFSSMTEAEAYECPWVGMQATIDGTKYVFSGDSQSGYEWVYQPSRLPSGYTEVEYVENTSSAYINTNLVLLENIGDSFEIKVKTYFTPYGNDFEYLFGTEQTSSPYTGIQLRYYQRNLQYSSDSNVVWTHIDNGDGTSGVTASCSSINATNGGNPLTLFCGLWSTGPWRFGRGKLYSFTVTKNNSIVRDLVPCTRDSDSMVGMYDLVNDVFYYPPNNGTLIAGDPV